MCLLSHQITLIVIIAKPQLYNRENKLFRYFIPNRNSFKKLQMFVIKMKMQFFDVENFIMLFYDPLAKCLFLTQCHGYLIFGTEYWWWLIFTVLS